MAGLSSACELRVWGEAGTVCFVACCYYATTGYMAVWTFSEDLHLCNDIVLGPCKVLDTKTGTSGSIAANATWSTQVYLTWIYCCNALRIYVTTGMGISDESVTKAFVHVCDASVRTSMVQFPRESLQFSSHS